VAVILAQAALLIVGPFAVVAAFGRGRAVRWDVAVVGAIAYVISEPFRILTAGVFGMAAVWQALSLYVPLRVYGVREREEPVTLGIAYGGAMAVSSGIAVLLSLPATTTLGAAAAAVVAAAAGMLLLPGLALFAAEAVRARQLRWLLAAVGLGMVANLGLPEAVAGAVATWWLGSLVPAASASDRSQ
jgi:hypothetical protein